MTITDVPASRRLARNLGRTADAGFVMHAAEATELVLRAIARADGSRAGVLEQLRASRVRDGLLGDFRFERNGDITPAKLTVLRVTGAPSPGVPQPARYRGATVDRVVEVPASLAD